MAIDKPSGSLVGAPRREPDGVGTCVMFPAMGCGFSPYIRSVISSRHRNNIYPDPDIIFEAFFRTRAVRISFMLCLR